MNGMITVGAYMISVDTAYKASVLGFLAIISTSLVYIAAWIST